MSRRPGKPAVLGRRPYWVYQRDTAVSRAHRGHGLGRCLKAHMIRVNHQLGFTTVRTMVAVNHDLAVLEAGLTT